MLNLRRADWGTKSIYISPDDSSTIIKLYPAQNTGFGPFFNIGVIAPAFRDENGVPQGVSFSINGDYYEVLINNLTLDGNPFTSSPYGEVAKILDQFFCGI